MNGWLWPGCGLIADATPREGIMSGMTADGTGEAAGKTRFDDIYDRPDPRSYFARLAPLEDEIPHQAQPVFRRAERAADPVPAPTWWCLMCAVPMASSGHPVHLRRAAGVRTAPGVGQRLRAAHRLLRAHHRLPGRLRAGHPRRYRPHLPAAGGFAGHTPGSVGPAWQPRNLRNPTTVAHPCSGCGPETRRTAGRTGRARSGLGTQCHATGNTGRTSRHRACGRTSA